MGILEVEGLSVVYPTQHGGVRALDRVSFSLDKGGSLGLVGESGCGKTTAGKAILRLLPDGAIEEGGRIVFEGEDLLKRSRQEMRRIRGHRIAMIPQSAMNALDPVRRIEDLILDAMRSHPELAGGASKGRVADLFQSVGLDAARVRDYPHMFSGGMRQRAIIALVFALRPSLIIADEPTTALDVIVQDQVLLKLSELIRETGTALILISHDIGVVAEHCKTTGIMYGGKLVEIGPTREILGAPRHPYTMGLQNGFLGLRGEMRDVISIPGTPPSLFAPPPGCRFQPRCPFAERRCAEDEPPLEEASAGHRVACHFHPQASHLREMAKSPRCWRVSLP